jgi:pyruvate,water dikinase
MVPYPANQAQINLSPSKKVAAAPWVLSLEQIDGATLPLVGGKAYRLAQLKQHGFKVPSGLVLTTHFFESQIQHTKLIPLWAGSPDIAVTAEALLWLADALKTKPLAPHLSQALQTALNDTLPDSQNFAVRSSVIDEDQHDHTFAGMHLTELGVPRSALPIAITRCWASALRGPAIKYRQAHGMSIQSIRVAVLIQPMLTPRSAGVAFTANPITGARNEVVIEATWGLSHRLVSGEIQPHFYRLSNQPPDYALIEQKPGAVRPAAAPHNGPLAPEEITRLAELLVQIQALMGQAQDVEWALQHDAFFVLQTRPIAAPPEPSLTVDQEWTRAGYLDSLPDLPSPLFGALLERAQPQLLLFFNQLGFDLKGAGPYEKLILGRPYLNLTLLKTVLAQLGWRPDHFLRAIGYIPVDTTPAKISLFNGATVWRANRHYRLLFKQLRELRRQTHLIQTMTQHINPFQPDASPADLLHQLAQQDKVFAALATAYAQVTLGIGLVSSLGSALLAPVTKSPIQTLYLIAQQGVKTRRAELAESVNVLSQDEQVNAYLNSQVEMVPDKPPIPAALKNWLAGYGHWAGYEADPACPRYGDDPAALLNLWQSQQQIAALDAARQKLPSINAWRAWAARPLINLLQRLLVLRETLDESRAEAMAALRRWHVVLGQKWRDQGRLEQPQDIFWLSLAEIEQAIMKETGQVLTLVSIVQARKETYAGYAKTQMPLLLRDSQIPQLQWGGGLVADTTEVMIGLPISPGQARGVVVVVHHPDEIEPLAETPMIFVMPSTDPAWLAHLHLASGLIVETGGLLSHGSIIAREYGLPAVANIPQATGRLRTGDVVLVDGSTGIVQVLERASNATVVS